MCSEDLSLGRYRWRRKCNAYLLKCEIIRAFAFEISDYISFKVIPTLLCYSFLSIFFITIALNYFECSRVIREYFKIHFKNTLEFGNFTYTNLSRY